MKEENESLISIVMPVKNAGLFLQECLKSICNQTEQHWELFAVDDHSTDDSKIFLNEFAKQDSRIGILSNNGSGIISALQTAYQATHGNFIHRMDADDVMPENKLQVLKQLLLEKGKGHVATGKVSYFSADELSDGFKKYEEWLNQLCENQNHWNEIYKECVVVSPCWMIFREDFEKCGGFNEETYPEDYDLIFRFYQSNYKVIASGETLHLWRDHGARASRTLAQYQENGFFKLKVDYFIELDYDKTRPLILWGAGKKGKTVAKLLQQKQIPFEWVSNNPNKHGKEIYNQLMASFESILKKDNPQVIINVAQKKAKEEIIDFLGRLNLKEAKDYWFFS